MQRRLIVVDDPDGDSNSLNNLVAELQKRGLKVYQVNSEPSLDLPVLSDQFSHSSIPENKETVELLLQFNKTQSDFLSNMSHELRTPLNSIIGFSELLQDQSFGSLNEKQARYVCNILNSGKNLLSLINDVLDLSKVEAGKMGIVFEHFQPWDIINEALYLVSEQASNKGVGLALRGQFFEVQARADQGKIKQILYNLLTNAVKFTPEGGLVEIEAALSGAKLEISVIDNGMGISSENQKLIFKQFQTLEKVLTKKQAGTGLGLALSLRLAELHQGFITVESEIGKGSKFKLVLPIDASLKDFI